MKSVFWGPSAGNSTVYVNSAGMDFIQNNMNGQITIGFAISTTDWTYTIDGYNATAYMPELEIFYAPPCSGQPNPGSDGCSDDDVIDSLELAGENATGFYDYATGCAGVNAYDDRTAQAPVDLLQGGNYNALISSLNSQEDYAAIWVDFDNNNIFNNNNERITAMTTPLESYMTPVQVNIPMSTPPGLHKMRVMVGYPNDMDATTFLPCNDNVDWDYGEVHDYTINVIANPLAITLESIAVKNEGPINILRWNTLTEDKTDAFEIERSSNAKDFEIIGRLDAKGSASSYRFRDEHALEGMNYYRLKMKSADAEKMYSKTVSAIVNTKGSVITVYPNPVSDLLHIGLNITPAENASIMLYDVTGKLILQKTMVSSKISIDVNHLQNGVYFVKYRDAHTTMSTMINKN